jgi:hypothetical protein
MCQQQNGCGSDRTRIAGLTADNASVKVPPGDYIAMGGCTANLEQTADSTVPAFGMAEAALTTDPNLFCEWRPGYVSRASVANAGTRPTPSGRGFGSASLSSSTGFDLPHGGTIYETRDTDSGVHGFGGSSAALIFSNQYVTAIRVGDLHKG